ncbi:zinc-ribbon domain-containing protein [Aromatoleum toluclasticum]|uniref:zinc-ribbon and DUF3426 domain-containing protein n=1 Tax=Aromatoleum toluclasticum TaxID=92003 RepID=UPI001D18EB49|nr:zinc-ribbon and DUF3426 domain-containing protein [Aromatoleum toluclasticum]MCC4117929.1 zinc-ribbon domain-containing protein [Aromatoleum toluclasticum]
MLARCPACHTVFRVRSEQLRTHHGQVRCGSCLVPFDALKNLIEEPLPPEAPRTPETAPDRSDRFFVLEDKAADAFSDQLDFELPDALVPQRAAQREAEDARQEPAEHPPPPPLPPDSAKDERRAAAVPSAPAENLNPVIDAPRTPGGTDGSLREPAHPGEEKIDTAARRKGVRSWRDIDHREEPEPAEEAAPDTLMPSFASPDRIEPGIPTLPDPEEDFPADESRPAPAEPPTDTEDDFADYAPPARAPARRALTGLAIGLLGGMLAVQLLYLFRADFAREWPSLRPVLVKACHALGCTVELPHIASLISVESSDLQSEPGKAAHFVLNAAIRNRAPHPLAWPHLELTLTDARDRPLVRRVLTPQEWFPGADLEQGFAAGRDIAVTLPFAADGLGATGYRIYAFYP